MLPRKALGKGLASLIPDLPSNNVTPISRPNTEGQGFEVGIDQLIPNRLQPRKHFNDDALQELAESIRTHGVIQPIVVNPLDNGQYEIIAGERRWRASRRAGLLQVPVVIKVVGNQVRLEMAIIENIQREDLDPMEEAMAYQELMRQFGYTQDQVADKVGKSRPAVANSLRLLNLPKVIQEDIVQNRLSAGHARALLSLESLQDQLTIREQILRAQLTVRDVERLVQFKKAPTTTAAEKTAAASLPPQWKQIQEDLTMSLGTKVILQPNADMKGGKIVIDYYSAQDLTRIHDILVERT